MGNICFLLDGTTGTQCQYEGPYKLNRNIPSMAFIGEVAAERDHGKPPIVERTTVLYCRPALYFKARRGGINALTPARVIEEQQSCTKFQERE